LNIIELGIPNVDQHPRNAMCLDPRKFPLIFEKRKMLLPKASSLTTILL
jgi:hypothetical protein